MENEKRVRIFSAMIIHLVSLYSLSLCLEIKPLNVTDNFSHQCYKTETGSIKDNLSPIEIEMVNSGAVKSKAVFITSDFGMIEKTIRLFIKDDSVRLVIHFFGPVDQIIGKYPAQIRTDKKMINIGNLKLESRDINSEVFDEVLSGVIAVKDFREAVKSEKMELLIDGISFEIPFECREEWRNLFEPK
jgi:hypothetical protein